MMGKTKAPAFSDTNHVVINTADVVKTSSPKEELAF